MQKLVREYLDELNRRRKKGRKIAVAVMLLVVMVVGTVAGVLTQYGIAMTGAPKCGLEEHTHGKDCYTKKLTCELKEGEGHKHTDECLKPEELTCGMGESEGHIHTDKCKGDPELTCGQEESESHKHTDDCYTQPEGYICGQEESEGHKHTGDCYARPEGYACGQEESEAHVHGDECYEEELTCKKKEHTHTDACYIDSNADVEDPASWDAQYAEVEWTDNWGENLAAAARVQVGYKESQNNYAVADNGVHKGYSRYGHFSGDMYRDWDAAFVNFCIYYAGLDASGWFPQEADSAKWQDEFNKIREENHAYLTGTEGYVPKTGDVIFFNKENEETPVQMGIVSGYNQEENKVFVIEGNCGNEVRENPYDAGDAHIVSYLKISEMAADGANEANGAPALIAEETDDGQNNTAGGDTYVNAFNILGVIDGSAPFDETEDDGTPVAVDKLDGDDANSHNNIVRTFDTVQYEFRVDMASRDEGKEHKDACIKLKFVLPVSKEQADFVTDAMSWLNPLEGEKLESKEIDGENGKQVVLEGEVNLHSDVRNVVPGSYGNTVTIKIKNMKNTQTMNPTFAAYMENNTEGEWKEIPAGEVTVSAAQKYNVLIDGMNSYIGNFDFSTGDGNAANRKGNSQFRGKAVKVGVALQLYNDSAAKGLKGIELPTQGTPITFDLEIDSKCGANEETAQNVEGVGNDYRPLLWSFEGSQIRGQNMEDEHGRVLEDLNWSRPMVPDNKHEDGKTEKDRACYNGGNWLATQNGNIISVTVSGWEINPEHMPKKNGLSDSTRDVYDANVGCFSAGEFVLVQPFNKENDIHPASSENPYQISQDAGITDLMFYMSIKLKDQLKIGEESHSSKTNIEVKRNFGLTLPGVLRNEVAYLKHGEKWLSPGYSEEDYPSGHFGHGDSYALTGETIDLAAGVTFMPGDYGRMCWATNLLKFDSGKLELQGRYHSNFGSESQNRATLDGSGMTNENTRVYYATKLDGSPWKNRNEMKATYEDNLKFYPSLESIPDGDVCVGILTCFKGKGTAEPIEAMYQVAHEAKVLKEDDNIGETCVLVSTSRAWPEKARDGSDNSFPGFPDGVFIGLPQGLPSGHMRNANTPGFGWVGAPVNNNVDYFWNEQGVACAWDYTNYDYCVDSIPKHGNNLWLWGPYGEHVGKFYQETTYADGENGIVATQHNSNEMDTGDTLLILGYKAKIAKSPVQTTVDKNNGNKRSVKELFNLNEDQRVVDYKLEPELEFKQGVGKAEGETTTVKIVDTLPEHTEYINGSTYFGGEYQQMSPEGGKQGKIIGGLPGGEEKQTDNTWLLTQTIEDPDYDAAITIKQERKLVNGRWVLTWTFENVPIARQIEPIYYSVKIQDSVVQSDKTTVPLSNVVYITSTDDRRPQKEEFGNLANKQVNAVYAMQDSHGKTVSQSIVEETGEIEYTVYYNNFLQNESPNVLLIDTMPKNGTLVGNEEKFRSDFEGSYEVEKWTLDEENIGGIAIYYPESEDTETNITQETVMAEGWNWQGWKQANVSGDGTITTVDNDPFPEVWVAYGNVAPGGSIHVTLNVKLDLGSRSDDKTNRLVNVVSGISKGASSNKFVTTETVRRVLEGLAWVDYNHNGTRDDGEESLSGVTVQLWEWDDSGNRYIPSCYNGTETPVVIQTGKQVSIRSTSPANIDSIPSYTPREGETAEDVKGSYRFMDLQDKTYAVRFIDPSGEEIQYELTKSNVGNDDTIDSDAELKPDPEANEGNEEKIIEISDLEMPSALEIQQIGEGAVYRLEHNDSGFCPKSGLQIQKTGENGQENLKGAIFAIYEKINEEELPVSFIKDEDGKYTMLDSEEQIVLSEKEEVLIARADKRDIVMCVTNGIIKPLSKPDDNSGGFQIYDVEGGYKAVKSVNGGWMALGQNNGVVIENSTSSSEEPPADEKFHWTFKKWQNGEYSIIPREQSDCVVGIGGADEDSISLSTGTDGMPCNFLLIPAARYGETTELEVGSTQDNIGHLEIKNLKSNTTYTIKELRSPDGYRVLSEPVEIKVDKNGIVTLTGTGGGMAEVMNANAPDDGDTGSGKLVLGLKIRNNEKYKLPSTGGVGIYWYSIGGILLMLGATLILYKNKCKEVWGG